MRLVDRYLYLQRLRERRREAREGNAGEVVLLRISEDASSSRVTEDGAYRLVEA